MFEQNYCWKKSVVGLGSTVADASVTTSLIECGLLVLAINNKLSTEAISTLLNSALLCLVSKIDHICLFVKRMHFICDLVA